MTDKFDQDLFDALGIPQEKRASLSRRSNMMIALSDFLQKKRWSKRKAARFFNVSTLTMKSLIKGHLSDLSEDILFHMCCHLPIKAISEETATAILYKIKNPITASRQLSLYRELDNAQA